MCEGHKLSASGTGARTPGKSEGERIIAPNSVAAVVASDDNRDSGSWEGEAPPKAVLSQWQAQEAAALTSRPQARDPRELGVQDRKSLWARGAWISP